MLDPGGFGRITEALIEVKLQPETPAVAFEALRRLLLREVQLGNG